MKPVIYQAVVRYFGNTNTTNQSAGTIGVNGCGKFADFNHAALESLKLFGVTHVWLAGCLRQATLTAYPEIGLSADDPDTVKGLAGSLFAVTDYFDLCPDYAAVPANRAVEFDALVGRIHAAGLKVILDLIPNHVARGYHSLVRPELELGAGDDTTKFFLPSNHFYYLVDPPGQKLTLSRPADWNPPGVSFDGQFAPEDGSAGHPPKVTADNCVSPHPAADSWYDAVKLNYGYDFPDRKGYYDPRPRTWDLIDQIVAYWQNKGVDGFRCDFAHYIPAEAWTYLIKQARQRHSDVLFVAEAYPWADSGDPVTDLQQLIDAGFDACYHYQAYNSLKQIYQGTASQDNYDHEMVFPAAAREHLVRYLENHDERRVASAVVVDTGPGGSGFGSMDAGYQLAPLQFLSGQGPVLLFNGQEVGEPGAGAEGFSTADGRTTFFDYWAMPEFAKWVNQKHFDGGGLSARQTALRNFYADLLELCQDPAVNGDGFWGLKYFNRPELFPDCPSDLYSFARFQSGSKRVVVVAGNFRLDGAIEGRVRLPQELVVAAQATGQLAVRLILDRGGKVASEVVGLTDAQLSRDGFPVSLPNQSTYVYEVIPTA